MFVENSGVGGGCVALRDVEIVEIEEATFYLNSGVSKCSALLFDGCQNTVVKSSKFIKNRAEGGATVYTYSSEVYFSWDVFEVNQGSPVSAIQSVESRLTIRKTRFSDGRRNSITLERSDTVIITLCRFVGSIADQILSHAGHIEQWDNTENLTMARHVFPILRNLPISGIVAQHGPDDDEKDPARVSLPIVVICVVVVSIVGGCTLGGKKQAKKPRVRENPDEKAELGDVQFAAVSEDSDA
jgi:hypothetical protein